MRTSRITLLGWVLLVAAILAVGTCLAEPTGKPRDQSAPSLGPGAATIAYWSFDEPSGTRCADSGGHGRDADTQPPGQPGLARVKGLFGGAMSFSGDHRLCVEGLDVAALPRLSMSVWVMPRDLGGYRELFRKEDGDNRILFSFQGGGTILSLGLNVGGYVECDATIDPATVLDGMWHHCAATFDGRFMRVYLDGKEVGSLERSGKITAGGAAPGCIGSSSGGECFQGEIDELALHADVLAPEQISAAYRDGLEAMKRASVELAEKLAAVYARQPSFAETVAAVRKNLVQRKAQGDRKLAGAATAMLRADFPDDLERFERRTGGVLREYLASTDDDVQVGLTDRLMELAAEYRPLTEGQWARRTPDERRRWEEFAAIEKEYHELAAQGAAKRFSPRWIELMLAAGERIDFRPSQNEPVAPYRKPQTPETRNLSPDEARDTLRRDWLHQAGGKPTVERIRSEIGWTRQLAERIAADYGVDFSAELRELAALAERAAAASGLDAELYFEVRRLKRAITFKNPVVDFDKVLLVDMPYPDGSEWRHETRHRLGYMAVPGARLLVLQGLSPEGKLRQLMPQA
ncbi:MAG: LamG domain-containing protein, partial [Planctomycetia bacterium]|nr:LamG domain-containing protein [Planctomycetia bacterium]